MSDVQTLAMLCSVFRAQAPPPDSYSLYGHHPSRSAPFPTHHSRYVSAEILLRFVLFMQVDTAPPQVIHENKRPDVNSPHRKYVVWDLDSVAPAAKLGP